MCFVAVALFAFSPALRAPFDFDDQPAIVQNLSLRSLWPSAELFRSSGIGSPLDGRPVAAYTFAVNEAINQWSGIAAGEDNARATFGLHLTNVVLHAATAFLLLLLVRATLLYGRVGTRWSERADRIALLVGVVWLIHPIQTEAVDYLTQRTEILASAFYLTAIYAAAVGLFSLGDRLHLSSNRRTWFLTALAAVVLGAGSKEIIVTAPLVLALYDRAFINDSWKSILGSAERRRFYLALVVTTAVSVGFFTMSGRGNTAGFQSGVPWYSYLYTQAWAVCRYIKLWFWPGQLSFDYGRNLIAPGGATVQFVALSALVLATLYAWTKPHLHWLAFLGSWFFLILAPSSSIVPIRTEVAAERRVYLAGAAIVVLIVVLVERVRIDANVSRARKLGIAAAVGLVYAALSGWTAHHARFDETLNPWLIQLVVGAIAGVVAWCVISPTRALRTIGLAAIGIVLTGATYTRSALYDDLVARWSDAVAKTPTNGRAYDNLAAALLRFEPPRIDAADSVLHRAMAVDSSFVPARVRSATIAIAENRLVDAETLLTRALAIHPRDAAATEQLAKVFVAQRRPADALPLLRQMADFRPTGATFSSLGLVWTQLQQLDSARAAFSRAALLDPFHVEPVRNVAAILIEQDRGAEAIPYIEKAMRLDPTALSLGLASLAYAQAGQSALAAQTADSAAVASNDNAAVYVYAGRAMQTIGRLDRAKQYLTKASLLRPNDPQTISRLGFVEISAGRRDDAAGLFRKALAITPNYPLAERGLDSLARLGARR